MQPITSLPPTRATVAPPEAQASRPAARPDPVERPNSPTLPNPALRLDAELGLVVLQFRDNNGKVVATIPTERELTAYRNGSSPTRQPGRAGSPAEPTPAPKAAPAGGASPGQPTGQPAAPTLGTSGTAPGDPQAARATAAASDAGAPAKAARSAA